MMYRKGGDVDEELGRMDGSLEFLECAVVGRRCLTEVRRVQWQWFARSEK